MFNYKMIIQYDGTNFCGWQIQKEQRSVQGEITNALNVLLKEDMSITGAGRTDAGVHAWGQVANFFSPIELDLYKFKYSLDSILPNDIVIKKMEKVAEDFSARFSATSRSYFYLISDGQSPFFNRFSYQIFRRLNLNLLNSLSQSLIGEKDFSAFSKNIAEQEKTFCNVHEIRWTQRGELIYFFIRADRFLHGMVRSIIGTLLKLHDENLSTDDLQKIVNSKHRSNAGISVPAKGLYLFKVSY